MKRVSFTVAQAIQKSGYPQDLYDGTYYYTEQERIFQYEHSLTYYPKILCVAPTYFDVWLWLWKEKDIHIEIIDSKITKQCYATINGEKDTILFNSPEDAIVTAIEHLVENNLIK